MENKYIFDKNTKTFLPFALKEEYELSEMWPVSGVEVGEDEFIQFTNLPDGKILSSDEKGNPTIDDAPSPSDSEMEEAFELTRNYLIQDANNYIAFRQWPGKAALGRLSDVDHKDYNAWIDYIDEIEKIAFSKKSVKWPKKPT